MGFSRQGYWSGLPFSSPGDLPNPGCKAKSPALQAGSPLTEPSVVGLRTWPVEPCSRCWCCSWIHSAGHPIFSWYDCGLLTQQVTLSWRLSPRIPPSSSWPMTRLSGLQRTDLLPQGEDNSMVRFVLQSFPVGLHWISSISEPLSCFPDLAYPSRLKVHTNRFI